MAWLVGVSMHCGFGSLASIWSNPSLIRSVHINVPQMDIVDIARNIRGSVALFDDDDFAVLDLHADSPESVDMDLDLALAVDVANSPASEADIDLDLHSEEVVESTGRLSGRADALGDAFNDMQRQVGAFVRHAGLDEAHGLGSCQDSEKNRRSDARTC